MILCVNIGNSNIALGLHDGGKWCRCWRLSTVTSRTVDEYELLVRPFIDQAGVLADAVDALAFASAVPALTETFSLLGPQMFNCEAFCVSSEIKTGLSFGIDNAKELGADLIANAVAGYRVVNQANNKAGQNRGVVIVDFGTALTFTVVDRFARVLGVVIAPGLNGALKSLASDTAQLPHVKLAAPPRAIGTNTIHSIQSGIVFGFTGLVESMVTRIRNEIEGDVAIVATGGLCRVVDANTNCFDYLEPWLHLEGIREIYRINLG